MASDGDGGVGMQSCVLRVAPNPLCMVVPVITVGGLERKKMVGAMCLLRDLGCVRVGRMNHSLLGRSSLVLVDLQVENTSRKVPKKTGVCFNSPQKCF